MRKYFFNSYLSLTLYFNASNNPKDSIWAPTLWMCEISPPNNDNQSDWVVFNLRRDNIKGLTQLQKVI